MSRCDVRVVQMILISLIKRYNSVEGVITLEQKAFKQNKRIKKAKRYDPS